jgi:hypothetical protein
MENHQKSRSEQDQSGDSKGDENEEISGQNPPSPMSEVVQVSEGRRKVNFGAEGGT